jgi:site-specific DNA recombinase
MLRAAIYARFSTDLQSEASIADQVRICRARCDREGWRVVSVHEDAAISGAVVKARPGVQALMAAARAGLIDVVVVEHLDRLSRKQSHLAAMFEELRFLRIELVTAGGHAVDIVQVGVHAMLGALALQQISEKTRRGVEGVVRSGRSGGGLSYGYRVRHQIGDDGRVIRGGLVVDDDQAAIVREIFACYLAGASPRAIAAELNARGVPGPRSQWRATTIAGDPAEGTGILRNRLYIGERVWGRRSFAKDPRSERRRARAVDQDGWIVTAAPELRILPDDVFADASQALSARSHVRTSGGSNRRPKRLLSGLVRCGACEAAMTVVNGGRLQCSAYRERGTCDNGTMVREDEVLERVVAALRRTLLDPDAIRVAVRAWHAKANAAGKDARRRRLELERERDELGRKRRRLEGMLGEVENWRPVHAECCRVIDRLDEIEVQLAGLIEAAPAITMHPGAADAYARAVSRMDVLLRDAAPDSEIFQAARAMIQSVVAGRRGADGNVTLTLTGDLSALLAWGQQGGREVVGAGARSVRFPTIIACEPVTRGAPISRKR